MLYLTRKVGESIYIEMPNSDEQIKIIVGSIKGNQAKLAFIAHKKYQIWREEIKNRIDEEKNNG